MTEAAEEFHQYSASSRPLCGPPSSPRSRALLRRQLLLTLTARPRSVDRAEHFRHAPRLRDTTARDVRLVGVEDFADRADTRLRKVVVEAAQQARRPFLIV